MDAVTNFASAVVSTTYNASATSIVLTTGHGARFPAVPFSAVWWNHTDFPGVWDDPNVEIVRVTARATDTLTVTRGQEGVAATTKSAAGKQYRMAQMVTAGLLNQLAFVPQNSKSAAYTFVLADAGGHILHPSADTTARIFTIPANGSVAYPIGTAITVVNQNAAGVITLAITTDTMRLAGAGTTGNRTLAANGILTALKIATTEWLVSGTGLT